MNNSSKVIIDKDILGWADEHEDELLTHFTEIIQVSKHPDLAQRSNDSEIADYCQKNGYALVTGDNRAYMHFFEAGIKTVTIMKYDYWKKADKPIYLIEIEE